MELNRITIIGRNFRIEFLPNRNARLIELLFLHQGGYRIRVQLTLFFETETGSLKRVISQNRLNICKCINPNFEYLGSIPED